MRINKVINSGTALRATLAGIQRKFSVGLGLERFVMSMHNNPKQQLRAAFGSTNYPYGWFKCSSIALDKERANIANIARFTSGHKISITDSNATITMNHYFPVTIQCECQVKFDNYEKGLLFIQQILIASPVKLLNFEILMPSDKWTVEIANEGDMVPMPVIDDLDDGSTPGTYSIDFTLTVKTKIGFNREAAKINNAGEVLVDYELDTGTDLKAEAYIDVSKKENPQP